MNKYNAADNGKVIGKFSIEEIVNFEQTGGEITHVYMKESGWITLSEFIRDNVKQEIPPPPSSAQDGLEPVNPVPEASEAVQEAGPAPTTSKVQDDNHAMKILAAVLVVIFIIAVLYHVQSNSEDPTSGTNSAQNSLTKHAPPKKVKSEYPEIRTNCPNVGPMQIANALYVGTDMDSMVGCRGYLTFQQNSVTPDGFTTVYTDQRTGLPSLIAKVGNQTNQITGRIYQNVPAIYVGVKEFNKVDGGTFRAGTYVLESVINGQNQK